MNNQKIVFSCGQWESVIKWFLLVNIYIPTRFTFYTASEIFIWKGIWKVFFYLSTKFFIEDLLMNITKKNFHLMIKETWDDGKVITFRALYITQGCRADLTVELFRCFNKQLRRTLKFVGGFDVWVPTYSSALKASIDWSNSWNLWRR